MYAFEAKETYSFYIGAFKPFWLDSQKEEKNHTHILYWDHIYVCVCVYIYIHICLKKDFY